MEEGDDRPVIDVSSGVGGGGGGGDVVIRRSDAVTEGADADLSTERTTPRAPSTVCLTVFSTVDWKPRAPSWTVLKPLWSLLDHFWDHFRGTETSP